MTNIKFFTDYLNYRVNLFPQWEDQFKLRVNELTVKKGKHLLFPGDYCQSLYFVKSGFFRVIERDDFGERTVYFAGDNQFVTSIRSFLNQTITNKSIVCEKAGLVFSINYNQLLELEQLSTDFVTLFKILLAQHFVLLKEENEIYRIANTATKYKYLTTRYPGITNIVSQKNIASYLGVTGATISNILRVLNKSHCCKITDRDTITNDIDATTM